MTPAIALASASADPTFSQEPWFVRWDSMGERRVEELVHDALPPTVELWTSGSTGAATCWIRTREQLWAEAGLLAELLAPERPQAVLTFAPPRHIYGLLTGVLVPARLRLPVWYRPEFGAMPPADPGMRWAVMAIPWAFSLMMQRMSWVESAARLAVVHSTALLPASAAELSGKVGGDRMAIREIFGSTETGGVATRRWTPDNPDWELFDDVTFAVPETDKESPLTVRSPRLAAPPGGPPPEIWQMDDHVEILDDRRFRFAGRRSRLVNVNGRRINLDELDASVRAELPCSDLALVPVSDPVIGEHFDLLLVPAEGVEPADINVREAFARFGVRPRQLRLVSEIDRSDTGKLRRVQPR